MTLLLVVKSVYFHNGAHFMVVEAGRFYMISGNFGMKSNDALYCVKFTLGEIAAAIPIFNNNALEDTSCY